jgi:hypothetical protein
MRHVEGSNLILITGEMGFLGTAAASELARHDERT